MAARKPAWLSKIKVVSDEALTKREPIKTPRQTFLTALEKQIKLIDWYNGDQTADKPEGREWFIVKNGVAYTYLKYAVKKIHILEGGDDKSIYEVGSTYNDIKDFYESVEEHTKKGEFDAIIEKTAQDMTEERAKSRLENKLKKAEKEEETHSTPDSVL